jgi:FkbM family methyltransferase
MKIFYGYDDQHYVNVTSTFMNQCLKDGKLMIPVGDGPRCDIVGFDPYPNILKHILIVDYHGNKYKFHHNRECVLSFEPIVKQLQDMNPKTWWHTVGKHNTNATERVQALHRQFNFDFGTLDHEFPEQVLAAWFVKSDAKVLEIGGNIGRNSLVLSSVLDTTDNLVVLESHPDYVPQLVHNLRQNGFATRVEGSALSYSKLLQHGWDTIPESAATEVHKDWKEVPTITMEQLEEKYQIQFDTIVADCEGALYFIFKDCPSVLDNIRMVIMENDYSDIDRKNMVDSILTMKGFTRTHHQAGGWGPCYEFFYEVWEKK